MHRDLKPANILISTEKQIKLIDFNVSRRFNGLNAKLMTKTGDPIYNAPEMLTDAQYTEQIDIWSIGLIFYELATGEQLFSSDHLPTLVQDI